MELDCERAWSSYSIRMREVGLEGAGLEGAVAVVVLGTAVVVVGLAVLVDNPAVPPPSLLGAGVNPAVPPPSLAVLVDNPAVPPPSLLGVGVGVWVIAATAAVVGAAVAPGAEISALHMHIESGQKTGT
jgi:hypothetical protein